SPPRMDPQEYEDLVSDMVRGILATELEKDITERVEPMFLDSLLHAELSAAGVDTEVQYGVFDEDSAWIPVALDHVIDTAALTHASHRIRLFRHDVTGAAYFLSVLLPPDAAPSEAGLWPMLISSVVFVALIGVAFAFTMRTLWRQKKLNDIRNDLVNNLTHELKTPISTIGLACEALADPSMPKTPEQVRNYTTMIRDENKRLGSLVENVLQSAVQDSGRMVIKPVQLDLHALIQDVVKSSTIQVSRRNGRIDLDLKAEIHSLVGDRIHLTNLLYNLVDNAVKYTEKEPRITIATSNDDEGATVRVTDNGIGIASSEQRKIFDKLYRVPTGNLHNAKGFGLGLSYVKSVVDRHKGRIKVESTPGQGSTFIVFLPFEHVSNGQAPRG
ncbi:MAG TPA: HAMP domain-containing sensor histidine kinase, partial [Flavobacteriales bacterium]|nr:HAMP domain-containing sensor histidine kinase [Flavobacteriales bacterium]